VPGTCLMCLIKTTGRTLQVCKSLGRLELAIAFVRVATEIAPSVYDVISTRVVSFVEKRAYIYLYFTILKKKQVAEEPLIYQETKCKCDIYKFNRECF